MIRDTHYNSLKNHISNLLSGISNHQKDLPDEIISQILRMYFGSSSPYNDVREKIDTYLDSVSFMPFVMTTTENRIDFIRHYIQNTSSVKGVFVLLDDNPEDTKPLINYLKEQKIEITLSSTWAIGSAGHDDELSVSNPSDGWGWLINFGADAIFTDCPQLLLNYLKSRNLHH